MKVGPFAKKIRTETDPLENSEHLTTLLVTLFGKGDTPELIAYLADGRNRLLLCKALVSPVSASDRQLEQRARRILRFRGMDPDELKKRLEPAAFALGLVSTCDVQVDYYDVLGVKPQATSSELRAAYRKRAFELHPDTGRQSSENETDFATLKAAYDTLKNPDSRAAFDQCRIALDTWHEEAPKEFTDKKPGKRPSGKARKAFYRVAAVVMVMVVIAWVISVVYESETLVQVVVVDSSNDTGPAREAGAPDSAAVEKKSPAHSMGFEEEAAAEKPEKKTVPAKTDPEPLQTAALRTPRKVNSENAAVTSETANPVVFPQAEPVETTKPASETESKPKVDSQPEKRKPARPEKNVPVPTVKTDRKADAEDKTVVAALAPMTPQLEQVASDKPEAVPLAEPEKSGSSPAIESKKNAEAAIKEPLGEAPKELAKPTKKKKVVEAVEVPKKQPSKPPAPVPPKSSEKPVQLTVKKESISSDFGMAPEMKPPLTDDVKPKKTQSAASATVQAKAPAVSEKPASPVTSVQLATNSPIKVFPDTPIPKTHETPFVERSQVVDFLKAYTSAYEKGNAQVFFSYFTDNALENGKSLKDIKPDYLKIWGKVQRLDYRISVGETKQVVGSEFVSMKGRFELNWKFFDGQEGQSHGDISMNLKVNDNVLRVSRLDYRFDE